MGYTITARYSRNLAAWFGRVYRLGKPDPCYEVSAPTKATALAMAQSWVREQQERRQAKQ